MGQVVIACYRVRDRQQSAFEDLLADHVPTLRRAELATARPVQLLKTEDGKIYLEIFEWATPDAPQKVHEHPMMKPIQDRLGLIAQPVPLAELTVAQTPFPRFIPVEGVVI